VLRIALGTVGPRRGGILGALVGVTVAVSLVVSSGIVLESTLRAEIPVDRLTAAAVVVDRGQSFNLPKSENGSTLPEQARLDSRLAGRLGALPGVERAIADRTFPAALVDSRGRPIAPGAGGYLPGHGWSSVALPGLVLTAGHAPGRASEVVLDARLAGSGALAVGDRVRILTASRRAVYTVAGLVGPQRGRASVSDAALYFRDDVAARLSGTGRRVELIGIVARPGADVSVLAREVRAVTAPLGLRVLTGSKRGEAESLEAVLGRDGLLSGLGVCAGLGIFVAVFVVASAFALSVQQRHREIALLRAIGATSRQVRRMIAVEALATAVAGTLLAAPLGFLIAYAERRAFIAAGLLPGDFRLIVGWIPVAIGLAAAVVTTQLASFVSGRRASRIEPVDALREAAVERRLLPPLRALCGFAAVAIGLAVFAATTRDVGGGGGDDAPAAGLVWMLAATLLGPLVGLPFVRLLGAPLQRLGGGPGLLARANTRANLRRLTSVATPLMLTVSLACALVISRATVESATRGQVARSVSADHVLVSRHGGLLPDVAASARRLHGVSGVAATLATSVVVARDAGGGTPTVVPARAVDGTEIAGAFDLGVDTGSLAGLHGRSVAVDTRLARRLGWRTGEQIRIWLGDGTPARLRVAALFRRPLGFGQIVLPRSVVAGHVTELLDDAVFVRSRPGANGDVGEALERLARARGGIEVLTRSQYLARVDREARRQSTAVYLLLGIVVLFSAIAAVNALAVAVSERARDLELLRLIGATRRQLTRMVRFEVLIVVTFAIVVGALTAAPGVVAFSIGKTGSPVPAVPLWLVGGVLGGAALLASAATVVPTRRALRDGRGSVTAGVE
jgi:putative ABC transport system permease protein